MKDNELEKFGELLIRMNELVQKPEDITAEKVKFRFHVLKDLTLEQIWKNFVLFVREKGDIFPPSTSDLRGPGGDNELQAQHTWDRINFYLERYYFPGFSSSMDIVKQQMEKRGEAWLYPYFCQWGTEILNADKIAPTRKHFLDSFKAKQQIEQIKQLEGAISMKELVGGIMGQIEEKTHE